MALEESSPEQPLSRISVAEYLMLSVQLALVLGVAVAYRLELDRGFGVVAGIIFIGFLIHAWLPVKIRFPFFLTLTLIAIGILLGGDGIWLLILGLALIGLCHLPIAWWARVGLIAVFGVGLAGLQLGWLGVGWADAVIPVLGAMFMFRLALYLYDLKYDKTPARFSQRLAYFFMLPNVCFPLFPVVDYKTFIQSYYDSPAAETYQKGIFWMLRGVSHLLMYRLIYYLLPAADARLEGIVGVYVFMAMTYGLYLRVSGLFHLITGSLCLFGFNLPPTNNHYFLASSFNDLWRRINIYWKDFMMTLVFYPVFMGLRRIPMDIRLVLSTAAVFFVTWLLHSYQWFWLQGTFPVTATDIGFWGFLGIALAANSLWEAHHRRRSLEAREWSWKQGLGVTGRTVAVFSTMAILWALWYSDSAMEWGYRLLRVRESGIEDWLLFSGLLVIALIAGTIGQWFGARGWGLSDLEQLAWRKASFVVPTMSAVLLIGGLPFVSAPPGGLEVRLVSKLKATEPNRIDLDRQERGYYEALSRATNFATADATSAPGLDDADVLFRQTDAVRNTDDIRGFEMVPGAAITFRGSTLNANRWGMRDRDYMQEKPAEVFRIALLGSSHVMGWGVGDDQTFENVLEDRFNREAAANSFHRVEILNFAVAGYALHHAVFLAEEIVPAFQPDVVMYVVHPHEQERLVKRLRILITGLKGEVGEEFEYVAQVLAESNAHAGLPAAEFERRLEPFGERLMEASLNRMGRSIRAYGAVPLLVLLPLTGDSFQAAEISTISRLGTNAGLTVISLAEAYRGYELESIRLSARDNHPNALGHRVVADRLYTALLENAGSLGLFSTTAGLRRSITDPPMRENSGL